MYGSRFWGRHSQVRIRPQQRGALLLWSAASGFLEPPKVRRQAQRREKIASACAAVRPRNDASSRFEYQRCANCHVCANVSHSPNPSGSPGPRRGCPLPTGRAGWSLRYGSGRRTTGARATESGPPPAARLVGRRVRHSGRSRSGRECALRLRRRNDASSRFEYQRCANCHVCANVSHSPNPPRRVLGPGADVLFRPEEKDGRSSMDQVVVPLAHSSGKWTNAGGASSWPLRTA